MKKQPTIQLSNIQALILVGIFGVYSIVLPSPLDIGELILYSIYDTSTCTTDFCVDNMNKILNYYHLGTLMMIPSGFGLATYLHKRK
jgi:hypothetical protein